MQTHTLLDDALHAALLSALARSRGRALIGTVGSTYSKAAAMMGRGFYIVVGSEFENKGDSSGG
jgi:hypothetical protein